MVSENKYIATVVMGIVVTCERVYPGCSSNCEFGERGSTTDSSDYSLHVLYHSNSHYHKYKSREHAQETHNQYNTSIESLSYVCQSLSMTSRKNNYFSQKSIVNAGIPLSKTLIFSGALQKF